MVLPSFCKRRRCCIINRRPCVSSGSDDSSFKGWDLRSGTDAPIFSNRKTHQAGVCSISCHPTHTHLVGTGSYDESVRLWDLRNTSRPVNVHELKTSGGNWRLKWHPLNPNYLLVAAMYEGFMVCRLSDDAASIEVVETYQGHGSIAYGADWWYGNGASRRLTQGDQQQADSSPLPRQQGLVATCSFYDKLLHLWTPQTLLS